MENAMMGREGEGGDDGRSRGGGGKVEAVAEDVKTDVKLE